MTAKDAGSSALVPGTPLRALEALAREVGAAALAGEAATLAERIAEGRFYVAVIGQFKRGKSTLINALVGDAVLPSGVVPVTAVVTVVRYGPKTAARVRAIDGEWREVALSDLEAYASEEKNPENAKGVAGIEVFAPSPLLASGMCLVDTPGLGSVFRGGTETTRAFVPHVDAALVVLGADPPISEDELVLVEQVSEQVRHFVFVLNKADRVSDAERREAKRFTDRILASRIEGDVGPVLEVSAKERLSTGADSRDWHRLRDTLARWSTETASALVADAERRGVALLADRLLRELDERREALVRPVAESEQRIEQLRSCAADAERTMRDLGYLLTAEQDRLGRQFAARRDEFVERTVSEARRELADGVHTLEGHGPALRGAAVSLAQEISRRWLDRWRAEEQAAAEALYQEAAQRFVELANQFLERLATSGETGLAGLSTSVGPELGFRVKSRLYYTDLWHVASRSPFGWFADLFRSRAAMERAVERSVGDYLEHLLYSNAARIESDFNERVLESRRLLESDIRARLKDVYASAERALEQADATRAAGAEAVQAEMGRLEALRGRVHTDVLR